MLLLNLVNPHINREVLFQVLVDGRFLYQISYYLSHISHIAFRKQGFRYSWSVLGRCDHFALRKLALHFGNSFYLLLLSGSIRKRIFDIRLTFRSWGFYLEERRVRLQHIIIPHIYLKRHIQIHKSEPFSGVEEVGSI